jgi:hypothetical protein|tara:strand:+ start:90 stop:290 length:201 start_codon:yes stop_codon:yes gene_type:complete
MSEHWKIKLVAVAIISFGAFLALGGELPGTTGVGSHSLRGWERILGGLPILLGLLLWIGSEPPKSK